jgi:hypothetical protein
VGALTVSADGARCLFEEDDRKGIREVEERDRERERKKRKQSVSEI